MTFAKKGLGKKDISRMERRPKLMSLAFWSVVMEMEGRLKQEKGIREAGKVRHYTLMITSRDIYNPWTN